MSELLSNLLAELVTLAALVTAPLAAEPAVAATEPSPRAAPALPASGTAPGGACRASEAACSAARMRWQVTLPAATLHRCRVVDCQAG
jgi:hypothetical protein